MGVSTSFHSGRRSRQKSQCVSRLRGAGAWGGGGSWQRGGGGESRHPGPRARRRRAPLTVDPCAARSPQALPRSWRTHLVPADCSCHRAMHRAWHQLGQRQGCTSGWSGAGPSRQTQQMGESSACLVRGARRGIQGDAGDVGCPRGRGFSEAPAGATPSLPPRWGLTSATIVIMRGRPSDGEPLGTLPMSPRVSEVADHTACPAARACAEVPKGSA